MPSVLQRFANLGLLLASSCAGVLGLEWLATRQVTRSPAARLLKAEGVPPQPTDSLSLVELVRQERHADSSAVFYLWASRTADVLASRGVEPALLPLTGPSHRRTWYCNEGEGWRSFIADRHGFNNPDAAWDGPVDLVLLGDSYALGQCVEPQDAPMALLRRLGHQGLSLGYSATGPVTQLGILLEYAKPFKPRDVIWTFFENDLTDVMEELPVPRLAAYLERQETQGLIGRTHERDSLLLAIQAEILRGDANRTRDLPFREYAIQRAKLWTLREMLRNWRATPWHPRPDVARAIRQAIGVGAREVAGWGGRLTLVYLPSWEELRFGVRRNAPYRALLAEEARRAGVRFIDATPTLVPGEPDWSLFPLGDRASAHYTPKGYGRVASLLSAAVRDSTQGPADD